MHDLTILTPTYTELVRGTLDGTYSEMILRQTFCVFQTQKNYEENKTTLVFQMVHGTNGLHIVRIVCGTNSQ